jgi:hypothetical protein
MNDRDREKVGLMISDFVAGCRYARPFHLVVIDGRGTVSVTCYGDNGSIDQVCSGPTRATNLRMISPITVTAISSDGSGGKSAKITVEKARVVMQ